MEKTAKKPKLKLVRTDGNVFSILGLAVRAARKAGWTQEQIAAFKKEAMSGDYNKAIATCCDYFEVR